jgi:hypothetical protein
MRRTKTEKKARAITNNKEGKRDGFIRISYFALYYGKLLYGRNERNTNRS